MKEMGRGENELESCTGSRRNDNCKGKTDGEPHNHLENIARMNCIRGPKEIQMKNAEAERLVTRGK